MCGSGRGRVCSNWANPAADWRVLAGGVAMGGWCTHCSSPIDDLHQLNEEGLGHDSLPRSSPTKAYDSRGGVDSTLGPVAALPCRPVWKSCSRNTCSPRSAGACGWPLGWLLHRRLDSPCQRGDVPGCWPSSESKDAQWKVGRRMEGEGGGRVGARRGGMQMQRCKMQRGGTKAPALQMRSCGTECLAVGLGRGSRGLGRLRSPLLHENGREPAVGDREEAERIKTTGAASSSRKGSGSKARRRQRNRAQLNPQSPNRLQRGCELHQFATDGPANDGP